MADVIEASATQLVLLDLWAPWCGPCKQLTPLLEQVTAQANGAVRLAKMNIDEHPAVAQQLQVQSIPAVFAFKNGQPVDGFMGALPESQIKEFVTRHLDDELAASPVEEMLAMAAHAMDQGDMVAAAQAYGQVLEQDPAHSGAIAGLAQAHFAAGNLDQAEQILAMAPENSTDPEIAARARHWRWPQNPMRWAKTQAPSWMRYQQTRTITKRALTLLLFIMGPANARRPWTLCWKLSPENAIGKTSARANNCSNFLMLMVPEMSLLLRHADACLQFCSVSHFVQ